MRKPTFCFPTWSDMNQAIRHKPGYTATELAISNLESRGMCADQLPGYCEADLRLCLYAKCLFSHDAALLQRHYIKPTRDEWTFPSLSFG